MIKLKKKRKEGLDWNANNYFISYFEADMEQTDTCILFSLANNELPKEINNEKALLSRAPARGLCNHQE